MVSLNDLVTIFKSFNVFDILRSVIEILIISFIIYYLFSIISRTRAVSILQGIGIIFIAFLLTYLLKLRVINQLFKFILIWIFFVALPIVFQPELRRALEQLGKHGFWSSFFGVEKTELLGIINNIVEAVEELAKNKIGALIVIERNIGLTEHTKSGTPLDSLISADLLKSIFLPGSNLHDGAVILRGTRILSTGCFLPLSDSDHLSKEMGSRHRAAIGITEVSDAISVVVSEERKEISLAYNGNILRDLTPKALKEMLQSLIIGK